MSLKLDIDFKKDPQYGGNDAKAFIATAKDDVSIYKPKYLIQYWEKFSEMKVFVSCSLFMHMDGASTCTNNIEGTFYLGLPISSKTAPPLYKCKDQKKLCK